MKKKVAYAASLLVAIAATWHARGRYARLADQLPYYTPFKNSLYRGLAENDFAHMFASDADKVVLREKFSFLEEEPTPRAKVLRLIRWIDAEVAEDEITSVRAVTLAEKKSGACESHALAVGVLSAFDVKARWISNVKSSKFFGYLEVWLDGKWELFRLRSGREDPSEHKSGWDLYLESEPTLSIRNFWWKPNQSWSSWKGSVYPGIFPFANVEKHPELEVILRTDQALLDTKYRILNPYDYVYGYFQMMDGKWTDEGTLMKEMHVHLDTPAMNHVRWEAHAINGLGLTVYED